MTDQFDRATGIEEALREDALAQQAWRAGMTGKTLDDSALHCIFCGEAIPEARRVAVLGVERCIDCQELFEKYGYRMHWDEE